LGRIDALQKERDSLRQQLNSYSVQQTQPKGSSSAGDDRAATLQKQLDDERRTSASQAEELTRLRNENATLRNAAAGKGATTQRPVPSLQDLTKAYTDGVRAFELDPKNALSALRRAVELHEGYVNSRGEYPLQQARMAGTRFVPYAPNAYLAAALFETKADCQEIKLVLRDASIENAPALKGRLDAARQACP
jgi:hypothetical protein